MADTSVAATSRRSRKLPRKPAARRATPARCGLQRRSNHLPGHHPAEQGVGRTRTDPGALGPAPFYTKDLSDIKGLSTINARAESITKAPTWREPMKKRRCIVPANSFYEWHKFAKPPKTPYSFELANGNPLGFAGLWDAWKDNQGTGSRASPSSPPKPTNS